MNYLLTLFFLTLNFVAICQCEPIELVGIIDYLEADPTDKDSLHVISQENASGPNEIHYYFEICYTPILGDETCRFEYSEQAWITVEAFPGLYLISRGAYDANCEPSDGLQTSFAGIQVTTPLPVELASFDAYPESERNVIQWKSLSEEGFGHYTLEKSSDGQVWSRCAVLLPNYSMQYQATDEFPHKETYYRLKMVDEDETFEYSEVVQVTRHSADPPPFLLVMQGQNVKGLIFSYDGKLIADSTANLAKGHYLITRELGGETKIQKLTIF